MFIEESDLPSWRRRAAVNNRITSLARKTIHVMSVSVATEMRLLQFLMPTELAICASRDTVSVIEPITDEKPRCARTFVNSDVLGVTCVNDLLFVSRTCGVERFHSETLLPFPEPETSLLAAPGAHLSSNVATNKSGTICAAGCSDGTVCIWQIATHHNSHRDHQKQEVKEEKQKQQEQRQQNPPPVSVPAHKDSVSRVHFLVSSVGLLLLISTGDCGNVSLIDPLVGGVLLKTFNFFNYQTLFVLPSSITQQQLQQQLQIQQQMQHQIRCSVRASSVFKNQVAIAWENLQGRVFSISSNGKNITEMVSFETPACATSMILTETLLLIACEDEAIQLCSIVHQHPSSTSSSSSSSSSSSLFANDSSSSVASCQVIAKCAAHLQSSSSLTRLCGGFLSSITDSILFDSNAPPFSSCFQSYNVSSGSDLIFWSVLPSFSSVDETRKIQKMSEEEARKKLKEKEAADEKAKKSANSSSSSTPTSSVSNSSFPSAAAAFALSSKASEAVRSVSAAAMQAATKAASVATSAFRRMSSREQQEEAEGGEGAGNEKLKSSSNEGENKSKSSSSSSSSSTNREKSISASSSSATSAAGSLSASTNRRTQTKEKGKEGEQKEEEEEVEKTKQDLLQLEMEEEDQPIEFVRLTRQLGIGDVVGIALMRL